MAQQILKVGEICTRMICECGCKELEHKGEGEHNGVYGRWYKCTACGSGVREGSKVCTTC